jgi:hypothetical protein
MSTAMPLPDDRNTLKFGPPQYPGQVEITAAMVEGVRQRIKGAGGILTVWAVLNEDVYETQFGDGFYLHAHGLALNGADAQKLAALGGGDSEWVGEVACAELSAGAGKRSAGFHRAMASR